MQYARAIKCELRYREGFRVYNFSILFAFSQIIKDFWKSVISTSFSTLVNSLLNNPYGVFEPISILFVPIGLVMTGIFQVSKTAVSM